MTHNLTSSYFYKHKVFQSILFNFSQQHHSDLVLGKVWGFFFFLTVIEAYLFILRQIALGLLVISRYENF